eukprot:COSAG01_NODE_19101_length_1030_cov_102.759398_1_plen_61_part_00
MRVAPVSLRYIEFEAGHYKLNKMRGHFQTVSQTDDATRSDYQAGLLTLFEDRQAALIAMG